MRIDSSNYFLKINHSSIWPSAVAESVDWRPRTREIGSSVPGRVKPLTYKIDTCHFLAWLLLLIGYGNDWLTECQDNVTGILGHDFPLGLHYKVAMSAYCHNTCNQDTTSSTPVLSPFQLLVSFPSLKVLSLKIPAGGGWSAFQHYNLTKTLNGAVTIETGTRRLWHNSLPFSLLKLTHSLFF